MKKILFLMLTVCMFATVFAQRPVVRQTPVRNNNQMSISRGDTDLRNATTRSKAYFYIIDEMSIANVTVMDANVTVRQQGNLDKIKVTVNTDGDLTYYLYDANNQAVTKGHFRGGNLVIDMSMYQSGEYRLQIIEQKGAERNFKLVKKEK